MRSQQSQNKQPDNMRDGFSLLYLLALSHATCLLVFMRGRFGAHFFAMNGLLAFVGILLYGAFAQSPEMFGFFIVWLAALIVQRIWSTVASRGRIEHSRYNGWPYLALLCPFVRRELTAKCVVEPAACMLAGSFLMPVSPALGSFVIMGMFSLLIIAATDQEITRTRTRAMRDALIEHQQLADRYREQHKD